MTDPVNVWNNVVLLRKKDWMRFNLFIAERVNQNSRIWWILLFNDARPYYIETNPLTCRADQWTGFYMIGYLRRERGTINPYNCLLENNNFSVKTKYD